MSDETPAAKILKTSSLDVPDAPGECDSVPSHPGIMLRLARQRAGLRQAEVAHARGVSRATIAAIEQGRRPVKASELRQLAALYHCTVDDLIGGSIVLPDPDPDAERVVKHLLRLKREQLIGRLLARRTTGDESVRVLLEVLRCHILGKQELEDLTAFLLHVLIEMETEDSEQVLDLLDTEKTMKRTGETMNNENSSVNQEVVDALASSEAHHASHTTGAKVLGHSGETAPLLPCPHAAMLLSHTRCPHCGACHHDQCEARTLPCVAVPAFTVEEQHDGDQLLVRFLDAHSATVQVWVNEQREPLTTDSPFIAYREFKNVHPEAVFVQPNEIDALASRRASEAHDRKEPKACS